MQSRGKYEAIKRWISTLFSEGVRGSSGITFHAFDDFGCPPGLEKGDNVDARVFFFMSEFSTIFELKNRGAREGPAAGAVPT